MKENVNNSTAAAQEAQTARGFYKLNWLQRIGFGSGDLAQNLIYQTICMYLLFFYTDIYGLDAGAAATMFLVVRLVDVLWDPIVGTYVDKHNPRLGKYRAYLVFAGLPLTAFAILCFWDGFSGSLLYAYITYVGMSMCYTFVNVPYGALNSSLTRDTMVPAIKRKIGKKNMFYVFLTIAIIGMAALYVISKFFDMKTNMTAIYIAQFIKSTGVIVATGYMWALVPEVISFAEYKTGRRISGIVNALTGIFFKADGYLLQGRYGPRRCGAGHRPGHDGLSCDGTGQHTAERPERVVLRHAHLRPRRLCPPALLLHPDQGARGHGPEGDRQRQGQRPLERVPPQLLVLAMFIISKYELTDEKVDEINEEIERRHMEEK